uniref:phosphatidyl-N-methylethanolamine N-methyltransferase n=1 Tax=Cucumis sativus TaxID=3659 RepID=A0A0A0LCJ2_CUCSA
MGIFAVIGVLLPFPYYYVLWNRPQLWVNLCGKSREPCKLMAQVSVFLKLLQFLSIIHVSSFSWPPPLYFWPLMAFGQFLNFRVYQLLGESGVYYGVRFGKNIPWVTEFPFGYIKDPQYVGSILSLFACLSWNNHEHRHPINGSICDQWQLVQASIILVMSMIKALEILNVIPV